MSNRVLRGTTAQNDAHLGNGGALVADITLKQLRLHDGATQGGLIVNPVPNDLLGFTRNLFGNSCFRLWEMPDTFTPTGYIAGGWRCGKAGSTSTVSRVQDTDGSYFFRYNTVPAPSGTSDYDSMNHHIDAYLHIDGDYATVSFDARVTTGTGDIAVEFYQFMGDGGSPSTSIPAVAVQKFTLSTTWTRFSMTAFIPSLQGKTLGTNRNAAVLATFWFSAGADFNSRTSSLGKKTQVVDLRRMQFERGAVATPYVEAPLWHDIQLAGYLTEIIGGFGTEPFRTGTGYWNTATTFLTYVPFKFKKKKIPILDLVKGSVTDMQITSQNTRYDISNLEMIDASDYGCVLRATSVASFTVGRMGMLVNGSSVFPVLRFNAL